MKNAQNFNESEESLDHILVYIINDLHRDRNERREALHGYQSGASKNLLTLPQIVVSMYKKQLLDSAAAEVCVENHGGNPWS
jgi:hypothetical protein